MKKRHLPIILLLLLIVQSCTTRKQTLYLQDLDAYSNSAIKYPMTPIQPNDILKIDVGDVNPTVAAPFNRTSSNTSESSVEMMKLKGYLVSPEGTITMPVLNEIKAAGVTPSKLENIIKDRLVNEGYLVSPTVSVRVLNNKFTILGEVNSPGVINFSEESISLLDAIGLAGDLTYFAVRKDVKLIRELDGKRVVYHIDLTSASWLSDPNFRIRQNDVIVVTPNKVKANSGGLIKDPLQLFSVAASLLTIFLLLR
ncbi:MAG TPA: polysaccharide biosynthesis/export family protein [Flavobacterium sp.]|uniref:polysaccharide biosynthesis/export family protein n=1 Tax=Flavobacterium flevense TaxID=983 RepID=UPI00090F13B5|nr:polysaccharide biosynthesis/export family protein [Flavobacterium flevense]SHM08286.1 polysaccharide export outer membrane protein [Flavobacterium flevense]HJR99353.1 polysaccharide biosynthesis/export family protein [Flavobacterium sp.]